jgi:hypothetical protein
MSQFPDYTPAPTQVAPSLSPIATRPSGGRNRLVSLGIFVVVIAALFGVAAVHSQSAPSTVKDFYQQLFTYNSDAAFKDICPGAQSAAKSSFDATAATLDTFKGKVTWDLSKIQYDLKDSGLSTANVHVHGSITGTSTSTSLTTPPVPIEEVDPLQLNGVNWCLNINKVGQ